MQHGAIARMSDNTSPDDTLPPEANDEAASIAQQVDEACADAGEAGDIETELAEQKDRYLRLQAEMQNLRNRTTREINDERRYGPLPLLREIMPVMDNIDRAIEAAEKDGESSGLLEGFRLVRQQLLAALEQHKCVPIEGLGDPFDPQVHDAILTQPSDDIPANHVMMVTQQGYQLHDRVVRPSQVIVSAGPAETESAE